MKVFSFSDLRQKTARFFAYHFMETSERQHFIRRRTWCNGGCLSWANTNGRLVQDPNPWTQYFPIETWVLWLEFLDFGAYMGVFHGISMFQRSFWRLQKISSQGRSPFLLQQNALQGTSVFGGVTFQKTVPLSYWDAWNPKRWFLRFAEIGWLPSGKLT